MKLLLDTQCWLWWFSQPERLSEAAIATIADQSNDLWLSVASIWEMGIKVSIGKLSLPESIDSYVSSRMTQLGTRPLEIKAYHAIQTTYLPLHHRDPFDRLLIAQAQSEELTLVTADAIFHQYGVEMLWAAM